MSAPDNASQVSGSRAILTAVSACGIDNSSSVMRSFYPQHDDLSRPAYSTLALCGNLSNANEAPCANYYTYGLMRQYSYSSSFADFSAREGGVILDPAAGYHLVCVSASSADASHVMQDGVIVLRYQVNVTAAPSKQANCSQRDQLADISNSTSPPSGFNPAMFSTPSQVWNATLSSNVSSFVPPSGSYPIFQLNQATGSAANAPTKPSGNFTLSRLGGDPEKSPLVTVFGVVFARWLSGSVTSAHIHGPAVAGSDGPAIVAICAANSSAVVLCNAVTVMPSTSSMFEWTQALPSAGLVLNSTLVLNGLLYLNIRTVANPSGELRGQLAVTSISPITS